AAERAMRRAIEVDPLEAFATVWLAFICQVSGRPEDTLDLVRRVRKISENPFYLTAYYTMRAQVHLARGDLGAAAKDLREGRAEKAIETSMRALEAVLWAHEGKHEEARQVVRELEKAPPLGFGGLLLAITASLRVGESDLALRFLSRPLFGN